MDTYKTIRPVYMPTTIEGYNDPQFQADMAEAKARYGEGNVITRLEDITSEEWDLFENHMPDHVLPRLVRRYLYGEQS